MGDSPGSPFAGAGGRKPRERRAKEKEEEVRPEDEFRRGEEWFLDTGTFADVEVLASGIIFRLHRFVLCRESHYFAEKLLVAKEKEISIDAEEAELKGLCQLMYIGGVSDEVFQDTAVQRMMDLKIKPERCLRICLLAVELGCPRVIEICKHYFDKNIDTNTAIFFLRGAWNVPSLEYFQNQCLDVMVTRFENYLGDDNVGMLQSEALCKVMLLAAARQPRPPKDTLFCSVGTKNLVLQDVQREVNRTTLRNMLALFPIINHENVVDLLSQCAKHGAEQEMERCIPVLSAHTPDVDRDRAMLLPRHVILNALRHEALSDIDHAYALGRDYLLKEKPDLKSEIDRMDRQGGQSLVDKGRRPRIGTEDWYAVELLDTLFLIRNRIKKRDMEAGRNLPTFRIMIVCAELFEDYRDDVRTKLVQSGCTQVDVVLAHQRNPSLEQLLTFHSILVWSNADFQDPESLGDILADAVDEGIGVVLCPYALNNPTTGGQGGGVTLSGRLVEQYLPCTKGFVQGGEELVMRPNNRQLSDHPECRPLLWGVEELSGGMESMHLTVEQKIGLESAVTVASWSNGCPAVLVNLPTKRRRGCVIVWNCRPGSSDVSAHGWKSSGHGQRLMFNMLKFASSTPTQAKCLV